MKIDGDRYLALAVILALSLWTAWYGASTGNIVTLVAGTGIATSAALSTLYLEGLLRKRRRGARVRVGHRRA